VRFVFLALIVVNLAFFGWAHWIDTPPKAPSAADREASIPPLQLVPRPQPPAASSGPAASAAPVASGAPAAATASGATAAAAPTRCRSLGPFEDGNAANAAAEHLRARGWDPRDRSAESTNPNVYWVYIGELTSESQRRAIQTLNAAGIHDAAVMTQPEQSDRVSVGVFADQAHAVRRAEQVRALGLKPTLGMRQRTMTAHWLDFDLKLNEADPQPADLLSAPAHAAYSLGPVKIADCPANSASG
jgi:hypothetical protein